MLIDKGYYDYDYQESKKKRKREELRNLVTVEETKMSDEELRSALAAFGWGRKSRAGELQEMVIKDINERANAHK